jgi:pimeloyl-ACP methyl ester carboxylesterase
VPRSAVAACLLALVLPACAGGPAVTPRRTVRFTTDDGVELTGDLRGNGSVGVVLAHMYPADRRTWAEFASLLADEGYRALNFDFRGFGDSQGTRHVPEMWRDVLAAVAELRARGAQRVVVIGASMGGTAALVAAAQTEVAGVVTLSAPSTFMNLSAPPEVVQAVDEPKLFIASQDDEQAAATAQEFYTEASGAKRVEIVTGDDHGTGLLEGTQAEVVRKAILTFLATQVAPA